MIYIVRPPEHPQKLNFWAFVSGGGAGLYAWALWRTLTGLRYLPSVGNVHTSRASSVFTVWHLRCSPRVWTDVRSRVSPAQEVSLCCGGLEDTEKCHCVQTKRSFRWWQWYHQTVWQRLLGKMTLTAACLDAAGDGGEWRARWEYATTADMVCFHSVGAAIFFEFKHYKPKKRFTSTKCFAFMEMDEIKAGPMVIEL